MKVRLDAAKVQRAMAERDLSRAKITRGTGLHKNTVGKTVGGLVVESTTAAMVMRFILSQRIISDLSEYLAS